MELRGCVCVILSDTCSVTCQHGVDASATHRVSVTCDGLCQEFDVACAGFG